MMEAAQLEGFIAVTFMLVKANARLVCGEFDQGPSRTLLNLPVEGNLSIYATNQQQPNFAINCDETLRIHLACIKHQVELFGSEFHVVTFSTVDFQVTNHFVAVLDFEQFFA